ncbi:COR domain-containing protein [Micromonospora sp. NPDC092111]|uniref:COR domain-containing protein n=1 Tax=Micromonospora sp. NPDC092111 TaxID=3364289 RepID=UPI0037F37EB1
MSTSVLDRIREAHRTGSTVLSLAGTRETELPREIGVLRHLHTLDLRYSRVHTLPPEVAALSQLEVLDANGGALTELPPEIGRLRRLRELDLGGCPLRGIPPQLWNCFALRRLRLDGNYQQLPPGIQQLRHLEWLHIEPTCRLAGLPRGFSALPSLTRLALAPTPDGTLSGELFRLPRLSRLVILGDGLLRLSPEIGRLTRLSELDLGDTTVTDLPTELADLPDLITLRARPTRLAEPLGELYRRGLPALLSYLRDEGRDGVPLYEIKVLLVGEGEVGKSSLVSAFHRDPFVVGRPTTHGIELSDLELRHPYEPQVGITFRMWDFGGQEVYRITHQFFFSRRSLYLLVWKPRQGQDENSIEFWLRLIRLRIGRDARVLIVATHGDERQPEIDLPHLRTKFAPSLLGQWVVDNASGRGLPEVESELAHQAARFPQMGHRLSKRWVAVRDELSAFTEPQIPYATYHALCEKHHLDPDAERALIELLHDLGNVVYFSEDDGLRDIIVLQPEWLTRAIGYVLEDRRTRADGGLLDHARLRQIWQSLEPDREHYPTAHHPYFLRLMEKFDVSYRLPETTKSLVAQLVPYQKPEVPWEKVPLRMGRINMVSLVCELSDEAPGLVSWLTVRNYRFSTGLHWRRGVFLRHQNYHLEALIELVDDKRLSLVVKGASPVYFFSILRDAIEDLLRSRWPGLTYRLLVPCINTLPDGPCAGTFPLTALDGFFQEGRQVVACHTCLHDIALPLLLTGFAGEQGSTFAALARQDRRIDEIERSLSAVNTTVSQIEEIASETALMLHGIRRMLATEVVDCPAMISISAVTTSRFNPARLVMHRFQLSLWCEFPDRQHRCDHPGYPFTRSREWFLRAEPYLTRLSMVLRLIPLTGAVTGLLSALDPARAAEMTRLKSEVDLMGAVTNLFPGASDHPHRPNSFAPAETGSRADEVAGFRAVRELLFELDPAREFGGLRRVVSESGDYLWVCPEHYSVYDPGLPEL